MFASIFDTNVEFAEASSKKVYGISAWNAFDYKRYTTDCVSLNNNDRQRLLKQQIRILVNMIPTDYSELILDEEDIDIFNPIEQMNGQCLCDFYLVKSQHVANRIKLQKNMKTRSNLIKTYMESQPDDYMKNTLQRFGLLCGENELINGFYGGNPLQRCFQGS